MDKKLQGTYEKFLLLSKLKDTAQRRLIFQSFIRLPSHLTAQEIYINIHNIDLRISQSTVYRNLKIFCEYGIAREIPSENGTLFEANLNRRHHDHMICDKCNRKIEFSSKELELLEKKIAQENNFKITHHNHILYGICSNCLQP